MQPPPDRVFQNTLRWAADVAKQLSAFRGLILEENDPTRLVQIEESRVGVGYSRPSPVALLPFSTAASPLRVSYGLISTSNSFLLHS